MFMSALFKDLSTKFQGSKNRFYENCDVLLLYNSAFNDKS